MYKRLQWYWLDCDTWSSIPRHIVEETCEILGEEEYPSRIDHDTRLDFAMRIQKAYLDSSLSKSQRSHRIRLWVTDEYPLIRKLLRDKRESDAFREMVHDNVNTRARIKQALPFGYVIKEITPIFRAKRLIVEIHSIYHSFPVKIPRIELPPDLQPYVVLCPWAQKYTWQDD